MATPEQDVGDAVPSSLFTPHELCESAVDYVLAHVNTVQYLIASIEEISGRPFHRNRIKCLCSHSSSSSSSTQTPSKLHANHVHAGYMWRRARSDCDQGDIVLVEDHIASYLATHAKKEAKLVQQDEKMSRMPRDEVLRTYYAPVLNQTERNLRHELIHAFDDTRGVVEPSDCLHHACSEIRAARLSGDCFASEEVRKGRFDFLQGGLKCVERRATMAVEGNPICRGFSERAVERVFARCYSDYEPFAAPIYALGSYGDAVFPNATMKAATKE